MDDISLKFKFMRQPPIGCSNKIKLQISHASFLQEPVQVSVVQVQVRILNPFDRGCHYNPVSHQWPLHCLKPSCMPCLLYSHPDEREYAPKCKHKIYKKKEKNTRKLNLIKKPFQDIFNNKRRNKKKTYKTVHFIRENSFLGKYKIREFFASFARHLKMALRSFCQIC